MYTKHITKELAEYKQIKKMMNGLFPIRERVPVSVLVAKSKKGLSDFLAYYEADQFIGFTLIVKNPALNYLFFLAVNPECQGKGYGTKILNYLDQHYTGCILLNIEEVVENAPNYDQRLKRQQFYEKNGYQFSGIQTEEVGVVYQSFIKNGRCTAEEYRRLILDFFGFPLKYIFKAKVWEITVDKK